MKSFGIFNMHTLKRSGVIFRRDGYTLTEMLAAVALIALLTAIAIPTVLTINASLTMKRLDETAKQIYIAAQNNISSVIASGNESALTDTTSSGGASKMPSLPEALKTYAEENGIDESVYLSRYYYIALDTETAKSVANKAVSLILPESSAGASVTSGYYVIEYDAVVGMVYGVFYAEEPFDYAVSISKYLKTQHREKESRKELDHKLGYYGTGEISDVQIVETVDVAVSLDNSSGLTLVITPLSDAAVYTVTVYSADDIDNSVTRYFETNNNATMITGAGVFSQPVTDGDVSLRIDTVTAQTDGSDGAFNGFARGESVVCEVEVAIVADGTKSVIPYKAKLTGTIPA